MSSDQKPQGEMMRYLPPIFHEDTLLAEYLTAFEKILIGAGDPHIRSLESIIANVARYFSPKDAPEEFLPWLATWMAFGMRADLDVARQRLFMGQVISLYKKRGTPESMKSLLRIFTRAEPTILEGDEMANKNSRSWVYWNVAKGYKKWATEEKPEHAFAVLLSFMKPEDDDNKTALEIERNLAIAAALIDLEKPAHTIFYLVPVFPSLTLPKFSTERARAKRENDPNARSHIGFDTMLGVRPAIEPTARRAARPDAKKKGARNASRKASSKKKQL